MPAYITVTIEHDENGDMLMRHSLRGEDAENDELQAAWAIYRIIELCGDYHQEPYGEMIIPFGQVLRKFIREGRNKFSRGDG